MVLTDTSDLSAVPCPFQFISAAISDMCLLKNFQEGELFFYRLVEYDKPKRQPDNELEAECGIGSIKKDGHTYILERDTVLSSIDGPSSTPTKFTHNKKLFLHTYVPEDYRLLFSIPNTVLATEVAGCPSPVELQNNTLLGRLNGTIQSVDRSELLEILGNNFVSDAIVNNENDISSPSSKFTLTGKDSLVTADSIRIKPRKRRPTKKVKGQMIYNDKDGTIEYWTGREWRTLTWSNK